jgi:DNA-binding MurR/RpiR family transcriptional regulator
MELEPAVSVMNARIGERLSRAYETLSESHRRAADLLLRKPFDAATMTIEEFAAAADISIATANRFARALGCDRYADFRSEIVEAIRPARAPEDKLRAARRSASAADTIASSLDEDAKNLRNTAAAFSKAQGEAAAGMLLEAARIFTVGFGTSGYLASYAANLLDPLLTDVRFVAVEGGTEQTARRLVKLRPRHLVVAITFPRYSRDIGAIVRLAKARGARVLAITDKPSSPIAALANLSLYAFAERRILSSSAVAALALIEALATAIACRRKGAIAALEELTEQVEPYLEEQEAARKRSRRRTNSHDRRT